MRNYKWYIINIGFICNLLKMYLVYIMFYLYSCCVFKNRKLVFFIRLTLIITH